MTTSDPLFGLPFEHRFEAEVLWPLSEALKSVPHLKPRAAAEDFRDIRLHLADLFDGIEGFRFVQMSDEIMARVLPLQLTEEDLEGVTLGASSGGDRITPKGARLLARFVRAGALPFSRKVNPLDADVSALEAYGAQEAELLEKSEGLRRDREARREARDAAWAALNDRARHLVQHPEEARPEELSRALIDRVFIQSPTHGYGRGGTLVLGGLSCHKDLDRYVSNSGKTRRTTPLVWWFDAEGRRHGDAEPDPVKNRRSDPDRNWGLGRE